MPSWITIREKLKYSGALRVGLDALSKVGLRVTPYYLVQEGLFGEPIAVLEKGFEEYDLRFLGPEHMAEAARFPGRVVPVEEMARRLKEGMLCFGAFHHGKVVAFTWIDLAWCNSHLCRFPLKANEGYLFDAFTWSAYRGRGLAPYLRYQTYKHLRERGIDRLYSISDALNNSSIKFKSKLKARFIRFSLFVGFGKHHNLHMTIWERHA